MSASAPLRADTFKPTMRIALAAALAALLAQAAPTTAHVVYVDTELAYRRFVEAHDVYRVVVYDAGHEGSLRLVAKLAAAGGHVATAAVSASSVPEFARGQVPRVIFEDRRRRRLGAPDGAAGEDDGGGADDAGVAPPNLVEYGRHHPAEGRMGDHWLLLAGLQSPTLAVGWFAELARRRPAERFMFARASPGSARLFATFGFRPYMENQVHFMRAGVARAQHSFQFVSRAEFDAGEAAMPPAPAAAAAS